MSDTEGQEPAQDPKPAEAKPADPPPDPALPRSVLGWIRDPFDEAGFKKALESHLAALSAKFQVEDYTILYLLDAVDELSSWHANQVYNAAAAANRTKPILLVLHNLGGSIEAGYLISKTCKRLANQRFVVAIPRKAKSAATLLALGADEVHMGLMSELGPIDPQIGGLPAMGMKNALDILSSLAAKYPGASTMLSEYIKAKLDLRILGYFERINESAMQYAERLLSTKTLPSEQTAATLADHFVNYYKDHGFVIDVDEARTLLGEAVVRQETREYAFANAVFQSFDFFRFFFEFMLSKDLDIVGGSGGSRVFDRKPA